MVNIKETVLDSRLDIITESDLQNILQTLTEYKDSLVKKVDEINYVRFDSLFTILTEVEVKETNEITSKIREHWQINLQSNFFFIPLSI